MQNPDRLLERQEVEDDVHLVRTDGRWKIDLFRFNLKFIEGNRELEKAT